MEVKYVKSGLANNFGTHIELHEKLKEWPELHDSLLRHELAHTNNKGFTMQDLLLDIREDNESIHYAKVIVFMAKHPSSLTQLLPIYIKEKKLIYDINLGLWWIFLSLMVAAGIYFAV